MLYVCIGLKDATKPKNNIYSKDILLGAQLCVFFFVVKRLENKHSLLFYLASQYHSYSMYYHIVQHIYYYYK